MIDHGCNEAEVGGGAKLELLLLRDNVARVNDDLTLDILSLAYLGRT